MDVHFSLIFSPSFGVLGPFVYAITSIVNGAIVLVWHFWPNVFSLWFWMCVCFLTSWNIRRRNEEGYFHNNLFLVKYEHSPSIIVLGRAVSPVLTWPCFKNSQTKSRWSTSLPGIMAFDTHLSPCHRLCVTCLHRVLTKLSTTYCTCVLDLCVVFWPVSQCIHNC